MSRVVPYGKPAFKRSMGGFTLPELVTTLVVIGILAAVAVPRFAERRGFDAFGQAEAIRQGLRYAQKSAVAKRRTVCVDLAGGVLTLRVSDAFNSACSGPLAAPASGQDYRLPASTGVAVSDSSFSYDAGGRPSAAQIITVSGGGVSQTILVEAESGYVH